MYPVLPRLFRPYFLLELPAWGRIYHLLGIHGKDNVDARWRYAPIKTCRGKDHGYVMQLRLSDDVDRDTYFLGRYYDLELQLALNELLAPGDTFLDVGANVGHTTLHAASVVGPTGRVIAIEPQPGCCDRIREAIRDNDLTHIEVHNLAGGEEEEELELKILGGGTIMAALAIDETVDGPTLRDTITVPVVPLDQLVAEDLSGKLLVKIDVEGFELYALRGMQEAIARYRPSVITEIAPRYLERAGVDAGQLFEFFHSRDYAGYVVGLEREGLRGSRLTLLPISSPDGIDIEADVLWVASEGAFDTAPWL